MVTTFQSCSVCVLLDRPATQGNETINYSTKQYVKVKSTVRGVHVDACMQTSCADLHVNTTMIPSKNAFCSQSHSYWRILTNKLAEGTPSREKTRPECNKINECCLSSKVLKKWFQKGKVHGRLTRTDAGMIASAGLWSVPFHLGSVSMVLYVLTCISHNTSRTDLHLCVHINDEHSIKLRTIIKQKSCWERLRFMSREPATNK